MKWVTLKKAAECTGYTVPALRMKISRSHLVEEVHWRRAQDNRILLHLPNFNTWCEQ